MDSAAYAQNDKALLARNDAALLDGKPDNA
jgi:hypothetical protein